MLVPVNRTLASKVGEHVDRAILESSEAGFCKLRGLSAADAAFRESARLSDPLRMASRREDFLFTKWRGSAGIMGRRRLA